MYDSTIAMKKRDKKRDWIEQHQAAMSQLPSRYHNALKAYYWENLSIKQLASRLNLSAGGAREILTKAVYLLKKEAGDPELKAAQRLLYGDGQEPRRTCS
jgi:DNA-directed RNA polymerase specialized sigma24 family protein